ncbi:unannotated protein [freshwater metagenome]|uniref:Unannotated protein n=1 Tax=freshwater metagenome TaxID=449393 RepID=A0A6J7C980_9ZZZZ
MGGSLRPTHGSAFTVPRTLNQFDLSPIADLNESPVMVTEPTVPNSLSCVTRPPQSPWPLRPVIEIEDSDPMEGYLAAMELALIATDQLWLGLRVTSSPSS